MSEYNQYITAVNKIFDYLSKMKVGWDGLDNINYIASIEEYRQVVIDNLKLFKNPSQPNNPVKEENQPTQEINQNNKEPAKEETKQ